MSVGEREFTCCHLELEHPCFSLFRFSWRYCLRSSIEEQHHCYFLSEPFRPNERHFADLLQKYPSSLAGGWKSCSFTESQGKHSESPRMAGWGMVGSEVFLQVSNVSPRNVLPWKKPNPVFIRPRNKVSVQRFCTTLKLSPLELSPVPGCALAN